MRRSWLIMGLGLGLLLVGAALGWPRPRVRRLAPRRGGSHGGATPTPCPLTWQVVASPERWRGG